MKSRLTVLAFTALCSGPVMADPCDHIRHDQLKYSECMRNDPSRNTPSGRSYEKYYQNTPDPEEPQQENSYDRERRLKREAAEAEQQRRENEYRERELVRKMQKDAAEQRAFEAKRANDLARVKRIRVTQLAAVNALAARLKDPKFDTPDTYDAILTAAIPEVDLMVDWAKKAYARFPNEFALRHWLVMRSSCHTVSTEQKFDPGFSPSSPCIPERKQAILEIPAAARQGDLPNRILNCAYLHFTFGTLEDTWGAGYLSEGKGIKAHWASTVEVEKMYTDVLAACEKDLGAALPAVKEGLFKMMWNLGKTRKNSIESYEPGYMWLLRSQAVWAGRTTMEALRDPGTAIQAIEKANALYNKRLQGE
ncbi:MAG: hypothetical protein IPK20_13245 [Betaproteobacteria bacterium]|nr:hypothetical protein [Betaproteobacteria bacterium]